MSTRKVLTCLVQDRNNNLAICTVQIAPVYCLPPFNINHIPVPLKLRELANALYCLELGQWYKYRGPGEAPDIRQFIAIHGTVLEDVPHALETSTGRWTNELGFDCGEARGCDERAA